jgi:hypothetical protein
MISSGFSVNWMTDPFRIGSESSLSEMARQLTALYLSECGGDTNAKISASRDGRPHQQNIHGPEPYRDSQSLFAPAQALHQGLLRARDYPLNRLLNADIRGMSGSDFELFLADVFRFLGYQVLQNRAQRRSGCGFDRLSKWRKNCCAGQMLRRLSW